MQISLPKKVCQIDANFSSSSQKNFKRRKSSRYHRKQKKNFLSPRQYFSKKFVCFFLPSRLHFIIEMLSIFESKKLTFQEKKVLDVLFFSPWRSKNLGISRKGQDVVRLKIELHYEVFCDAFDPRGGFFSSPRIFFFFLRFETR